MTPDFLRIVNLVGATTQDAQLTLRDYIDAATAIEAVRLGSSSGLSDATRAMIIEHLSAALYEMQGGGGVSSHRLTDETISYSTDAAAISNMLASSRHGQIAAMLDTSGALAAATKPRASFVVL